METIESPGKRKRNESNDSEDEHSRKRKIVDAGGGDGEEDGEIVEDDQVNDQESEDDCQIIDQSITIVNLDTTIEQDDDNGDQQEDDLIENDNENDHTTIKNDEPVKSPLILSDLIEIDSYTKPTSPQLITDSLFTITFTSSNIFNELKGDIRQLLKSFFHTKMNKSINVIENDLMLEIRDSSDAIDGSCLDSSSNGDLFGNLFTIDACPSVMAKTSRNTFVPQYDVSGTKVFDHKKDIEINEDDICKRPKKSKNPCFNCDGEHTIRDCPEPKNFAKIRENRKNYGSNRVERYHVDAEQRFGQFLPGAISETLRKALGYRSRQLPQHIYRMRELGYPPGWLENAKISKSGLTLFDSKGNNIGLDKEEAGEIPEEVEYNLKKIISFPGFNVSPPSGTLDESCDYRAIPMQPHQSKQELIKMLQANSTKSYKRKKLSNLPIADDSENNNDDVTVKESINSAKNIQLELTSAEMDIDSSDDIPIMPVGVITNLAEPPLPIEPPNDTSGNTTPPPPPPPPPDSETDRIDSPTLIDLRKQKELLLAALNSSTISTTTLDDTLCDGDSTVNDSLIDDIISLDRTGTGIDGETDVSSASIMNQSNETSILDSTSITKKDSDISNPTPTPTTLNKSKHHVFGTPLIESASSFSVLPTGKKWSEGVSDVIDFENLPESTGKYVQMKGVIEKVRNIVKQLNDECENED